MSLLDDGPDQVLIYPEVAGDDGYGTPEWVPSQVPVTVWTRVQPITAEEAADLGQDVDTTYRFRTSQPLPAGAFAKVTWDGRDWDVLGEPKRHNGSAATASKTVHIKARRAKEPPTAGV